MAEKKAAPVATEPERIYPNIEQFLEANPRDAIANRFADTRKALEALPKPKAEQGKRALLALSKTEALLNQLFDVKEKLEADAKNPKKARK